MIEYQLKKLCPTELPLVVQIRKTPYYQVIHRHDAVELVYIRHGSGWCAINGVIHPMMTGDLYVIPIGFTHEYSSDSGLDYVNCLFNREIFQPDEQELYNCFLPDTPETLAVKYTLGPYLREKLSSQLDELYSELNSNLPYHSALSRALLIRMLTFIIRNASRSTGIQASVSQRQLGRVLCYIADHITEKMDTEKLAKIAEYTPSYFVKLFHREIGCGIAEYIQTRRLEHAALALETASDTIESIAWNNGFSDASYFVKVFRKRFGCTPSKFRKMNRNHSEAISKQQSPVE